MQDHRDNNIQHPEAWELLVSINGRQIDYMMFAPTVANSLIIKQAAAADDTMQALEDAVYDTPELLDEYKRVRVVVHSSRFVLFPQETADDDCEALVRHAFPDGDGEAAVCPVPANGVKMAFLMPHGMMAFLGRTFNYPVVSHPLALLCEHFVDLSGGDARSRMCLHLRPQAMDMAIYREGRLQCANVYPFSAVEDAVYYAMNAWRTFDLDQLSDELLLMGDNEVLATITPLLREFVKYVMPATYPAAAMRLGRNAMQAPLDLILLALCE